MPRSGCNTCAHHEEKIPTHFTLHSFFQAYLERDAKEMKAKMEAESKALQEKLDKEASALKSKMSEDEETRKKETKALQEKLEREKEALAKQVINSKYNSNFDISLLCLQKIFRQLEALYYSSVKALSFWLWRKY